MRVLRYFIIACAISLGLTWSEPAAAQRMKAGLLTCDVSAGIGYIIGSHNPTLLNGEEGKKRDDCGTGQNWPQGLSLFFGHGSLVKTDIFTNMGTLPASPQY